MVYSVAVYSHYQRFFDSVEDIDCCPCKVCSYGFRKTDLCVQILESQDCLYDRVTNVSLKYYDIQATINLYVIMTIWRISLIFK